MVVAYSTSINHYTALNLTKLDILDTFETIKVATAYIDPDTGEELKSFPADLSLLAKVKVVYQELPGWNKPTTGAKTYVCIHSDFLYILQALKSYPSNQLSLDSCWRKYEADCTYLDSTIYPSKPENTSNSSKSLSE